MSRAAARLTITAFTRTSGRAPSPGADLDRFLALKVQGLKPRYSEEDQFLFPNTERSAGSCFSRRLSCSSEEKALAVCRLVLILALPNHSWGTRVNLSPGFYESEEWAGFGGEYKNTAP